MDAKFQVLLINDIELDIRNPRIAQYIEMYGDEITAEQMSLALGAGDSQKSDSGTTFQSLRESIRTNGGVIHPIIVNKEPSGKHIVIEGNTRVLIYREFLETKTKGDWTRIPAMVYTNLPESEIESIRLQAHLVGPRAWDPYSKAKYLDHLQKTKHLTISQIVDFCGGKKSEVLDYIAAYNDMEKYYRPALPSDGDFDPSRFSAFVELQSNRVKTALAKSGMNFTDFSKWIINRLIFPLSTVRQIPRILGDENAKNIFLKRGAREALKILEAPQADSVLKDLSLTQLARELAKRIASLPYEEITKMRDAKESDDVDILVDVRDSLTNLCEDIS